MEQSQTQATKTLAVVFGMVLGLGLIYWIQQSFFKPPMFDKVLVQATNEINKTCPRRVDEDQVLNNVVALPGKTLQYNFTLVRYAKDEINLDTVKKYVFSNILQNIKTNPDLKIYRDHKTTFVYHYSDKNGAFVDKYVVPPNDYLK